MLRKVLIIVGSFILTLTVISEANAGHERETRTQEEVSKYLEDSQRCTKEVSEELGITNPYDNTTPEYDRLYHECMKTGQTAEGNEPAATGDKGENEGEESEVGFSREFIETLFDLGPTPEDFAVSKDDQAFYEEKLATAAKTDHKIHAIRVIGEVHAQLPGGEIVVVAESDTFPVGTVFITEGDSELKAYVSGGRTLLTGRDSKVSFEEVVEGAVSELRVFKGSIRLQGQLLRASSPAGAAIVTKGTDFAVDYSPETGLTMAEIYNGTIEVQSEKTGDSRTISSGYKKDPKRLEVSEDGAMKELTWSGDSGFNPKRLLNEQPLFTVFVVLALLGLAGYGLLRLRR